MSAVRRGKVPRADNVRVERGLSGDYIIVTHDDQVVFLYCPCCEVAFRTMAAAQTVADKFRPPQIGYLN